MQNAHCRMKMGPVVLGLRPLIPDPYLRCILRIDEAAARAKSRIDAIADHKMAMLTTSVGFGSPERERTLLSVVHSQSRKHMLTVNASMLPPRAGALTSKRVRFEGNFVDAIGLRRAFYQVKPSLWIDRKNVQVAARALEPFNVDNITL